MNGHVIRGIIVALLLVAARSDADPATAQAAFKRGEDLRKQGKWDEACPLFEASYNADAQLGVLLHLADCHEHIGRTATAWAEFNDAAGLAHAKNDPREAVARKRADAIAPKLAKLRLALPPTPISGLVVKRGTVDITALAGSDIPLDPGEHEITASAPGFVAWTQKITIAPGAVRELAIPMLEKVAAPPVETTPEKVAEKPVATAPAIQPATPAPATAPSAGEADTQTPTTVTAHKPLTLAASAGAGVYGINMQGPTPSSNVCDIGGSPPRCDLAMKGPVAITMGAAIGVRYAPVQRFDVGVGLGFLWGGPQTRTQDGGGTYQIAAQLIYVDAGVRVRPFSRNGWFLGVGASLLERFASASGTTSNGAPFNVSLTDLAPAVAPETGVVFGRRDQFGVRLRADITLGHIAGDDTVTPRVGPLWAGFRLYFDWAFY